MLAPLLADRLRDDRVQVASTPDLGAALREAGWLAVVIAAPEAWSLEEELRSNAGAPVIALMAAGSMAIAGVTAALVRPARLDALVGVIKAMPRNAALAPVEIGPLTLDVKTRRLSDRSGIERARLTEKEAEILCALFRAPAGQIARDVLMRDVWRYHDAVQSHTMETHIYRLRRKLIEAEPSLAGVIETVAGGYRLRLGDQA